MKILIDDAYLIPKFEQNDLSSALKKIINCFVDYNSDLGRTIFNELLTAERERSFVLDGGVLIPHVPVESMCHIGWFRSVKGVPTDIASRSAIGMQNEERAYIIFCALASDSVLRDIMGYVCEILRHYSFRYQFQHAKTDGALRQAILSHLRMHFDRHGSEKQQWKEMGPHHLSPYEVNGDIFRAQASINNRRGLDARFSAGFVKLVRDLDCEVTVCRRGFAVSGRSILGLMMLACGCGGFVEVAAVGREAKYAMEILPQYLESKLPPEFYLPGYGTNI